MALETDAQRLERVRTNVENADHLLHLRTTVIRIEDTRWLLAQAAQAGELRAALRSLFAEAPKDTSRLGDTVDPMTYNAALNAARRHLEVKP